MRAGEGGFLDDPAHRRGVQGLHLQWHGGDQAGGRHYGHRRFRILTFHAPNWTFAETDQPQVAVNFVGPESVWPNLTAVVEIPSAGSRLLHIAFIVERTGELDALLARSQRLQLTHDGRELGVFATPDASAAVAALQRCDRARQ